jgi:hypothetical protein
VDNEAADEDDALAQLRRFLSYLPVNAWEAPPIAASSDPPDRREEELVSIVPRERRKPYKARRIVELVLDGGSVFELGARHGRSLITALARLGGRPVGVLCSDPNHYAGGLTADASEKLTRFVDVCDQFRLPVVNFVDQPGFVIGTEAERRGTIRRGTRALTAVYQASVPWVSVLVRKVYGVAGAAHGDASRLNLRYAWPSGDWGSLPIEGGIEAAYRRELEAADDPLARRAEIEERLNAVRSPFRTAERFMVEEIIDPRDTRPLLCDWAARAHELIAHDVHSGPKSRGLRPCSEALPHCNREQHERDHGHDDEHDQVRPQRRGRLAARAGSGRRFRGPAPADHAGERARDELVEAHLLALRGSRELGVQRLGHAHEQPAAVRRRRTGLRDLPTRGERVGDPLVHRSLDPLHRLVRAIPAGAAAGQLLDLSGPASLRAGASHELDVVRLVDPLRLLCRACGHGCNVRFGRLAGQTAARALSRRPRAALELDPELVERLPRRSRQLPRREPDFTGDLPRLEVADIAEVEDAALALVEAADGPGEEDPVLDRVELGGATLGFLAELKRLRGTTGIERHCHILLGRAQLASDLGLARRASQLRRQLPLRLGCRRPQLLHATRKPHAAGTIAPIAPHLAADVRHREREELVAPVGLEAVDRLDQPDASDLVEVVVIVRGA